jgi:hypothetical protein
MTQIVEMTDTQSIRSLSDEGLEDLIAVRVNVEGLEAQRVAILTEVTRLLHAGSDLRSIPRDTVEFYQRNTACSSCIKLP